MPKYEYKCDECGNTYDFTMSVREYEEYSKQSHACNDAKPGAMQVCEGVLERVFTGFTWQWGEGVTP